MSVGVTTDQKQTNQKPKLRWPTSTDNSSTKNTLIFIME